MVNPVDPLAARISLDQRSGLLYYTMAKGTSIGDTAVRSRSHLTLERSDSRMEPSAMFQYSSGITDTGSSLGIYADQYVEEDPLPRLEKDSTLQLYYIHMQRALRTCHPVALCAETSKLWEDVATKGDDVKVSMPRMAGTLAGAGCRKIEYSRSCALIAHGILCQVQEISPTGADLFVESLVGAVMEVFDQHYLKKNLWHLGGSHGLTNVEEEMINVAAFAGDLFALGLLSLQTVHDRIIHNLAYAPVVSAVHCRALYAFLLHAKAHIGPSIGMGKLGKVRKQLIVCMNACPMLYEPKVRLWVVECCEVIKQTAEQDCIAQRDGRPPVVVHEWDAAISEGDWFSSLVL